ncbi:MAG: phosphoribosylanthranilate isomerase, partial [Armatimonadota bacterium]
EAPSPRAVTVEVAARLARLAPERIVAVVVSRDEAFLRRVIREVQPRALQLHGPHAPELVARFADRCPVWVAVPVPAADSVGETSAARTLAIIGQAAVAGAELIVLDTAVSGQSGGTGQVSDWALAAQIVAQSPLPVLLAGGISPDNAAEALAQVQPAGLDASSRLERSPGRKDPQRVRALGRVVKG